MRGLLNISGPRPTDTSDKPARTSGRELAARSYGFVGVLRSGDSEDVVSVRGICAAHQLWLDISNGSIILITDGVTLAD